MRGRFHLHHGRDDGLQRQLGLDLYGNNGHDRLQRKHIERFGLLFLHDEFRRGRADLDVFELHLRSGHRNGRNHLSHPYRQRADLQQRYFGSCHSKYESIPSDNNANPNLISDQNYIALIPKSPQVVAAGPASSGDLVGVAANGIAICNNEAAAPDTLANELYTMDSGTGHPTNLGKCHYRSDPSKLTATDDGALTGSCWTGSKRIRKRATAARRTSHPYRRP